MNVMVGAARKAGKSLVRDFGEVEQLQVSLKGPGNFVSAADHRAEQIIYDELSKAREGYGFLMEERGAVEGADKTHRWIVDPLDGTTNFLHGIPIFNISIGLEREGQVVAGVVYNPAMDELYTVEKGKGAFMNDRRLRVSGRKNLIDCVFSTGTPTMTATVHDKFLGEVRTVMNKVASFRRIGAAALDLCWVASGRFDGFWERNLHAWDMAAGLLMVREAGGFVTDINGGTDMFGTHSIVAANTHMHKPLLELVSGT
jgi:myo-inositol-1(or 4)-monophosphatase